MESQHKTEVVNLEVLIDSYFFVKKYNIKKLKKQT